MLPIHRTSAATHTRFDMKPAALLHRRVRRLLIMDSVVCFGIFNGWAPRNKRDDCVAYSVGCVVVIKVVLLDHVCMISTHPPPLSPAVIHSMKMQVQITVQSISLFEQISAKHVYLQYSCLHRSRSAIASRPGSGDAAAGIRDRCVPTCEDGLQLDGIHGKGPWYHRYRTS